MKERDFFKEYVQDHKEDFENEVLPPNMLGNILNKLKEKEALVEEQRQTTKKFRLNYTWLAAACTLIIAGAAFLFVSKDDKGVMPQEPKLVSNGAATVASPTVSKVEQPIIETASSFKPMPVKSATKHLAQQQKMRTAHEDIFEGLADSSSVAKRLDALLKAGALASLNTEMKTQLCKTFNEDSNDNVRLAALEVLAKFAGEQYVQEQLTAGLSKQKDPVVQLELIKIIGNNSNPETTNKLIAMANNPFTVDAVKEQVYYALLNNQ